VHFRILILKFYLQSSAGKYVIVVFLAINSDTDITRNSSTDEIAKAKIILYELQTQAALYGCQMPVVWSGLNK